MDFWESLLVWLIIFVCALVMLVILIQRGRGGGLTGAFGGAGGSSAFGAKTGDVFTWITVIIVGVWGLLQIVANFALDKSAIAIQTNTATSTGESGSTTESIELPITTVPVQEPPATTTQPGAGTETPTEAPAEKPAEQPAGDGSAEGAPDNGGTGSGETGNDKSGGQPAPENTENSGG
ncbi:MAG: preprotein translocase subunit SecG [Planctomycetota bacterium]|jgi:preprotein translocase subunit SecG